MATNNAINSRYPIIYCQFITGLDLTATGSTKVFTTPSGINSFITTAVAVQIATSNTFVSPATISIGFNATSYNNILAATALTGLSTVGNYLHIPIVALAAGANASTDIFVNVTSGAVATALTGKVLIIGVNV